MNEELQNKINIELDKRINKDLIHAVYEVRTMFNLTNEEFYPYYKAWQMQ